MKSIDILRPVSIRVETDQGWIEAGKSGDEWVGGGITIALSVADEGTKLTAASDGAPLLAIAVRWETAFEERMLAFGDAWERGYGDLGWESLRGERSYHWYVLMDEKGTHSGLGVRTLTSAMVSWRLDACGAVMIADTSVGAVGVRLGKRTLDVCTIVVAQNEQAPSAYAFACDYMKRLTGPVKAPSQVIYGGNNWYYAYGISSHDRILADSEFIAEMASKAAVKPYMVIDDGWQLTSGRGVCNGGPWIGNRDFPDMPGLAAEMKNRGVKPGIWVRPLLTSENMPDGWIRGTAKHGRILDPTRPDVVEYVRETMETLSKWGYELIKHDFSTFDIFGLWGMERKNYRDFAGGAFADDSYTLAEQVVNLYQAIRRGAGDAAIIGCNTIGHLCAGIFEISRTGDDTSGKCWERTRRMGPNTLAMRMPQHRTFFECDADCVGITDQVDWKLNAQWLQLLANSGTPLFVSADGALLNAEQKSALRQAFTVASQQLPVAEPLDWQSNFAPAKWQFGSETMQFDWYEAPKSEYPSEVWWI